MNQASRLCGEASAEEILITQRVASVCDGLLESESIGTINLKGFRQAINCHRLLNVKA